MGIKVFAGQRHDGFFVDLGVGVRPGRAAPVPSLHLVPTPGAPGRNALAGLNVHTLAIQVPIDQLADSAQRPTDPLAGDATIGVYTSALRQKALVREDGRDKSAGPFVQVSRLGNPLINEVVIPLGDKDRWNSTEPSDDAQFAGYVAQPELGRLLPILYPNVFPNLAA